MGEFESAEAQAVLRYLAGYFASNDPAAKHLSSIQNILKDQPSLLEEKDQNSVPLFVYFLKIPTSTEPKHHLPMLAQMLTQLMNVKFDLFKRPEAEAKLVHAAIHTILLTSSTALPNTDPLATLNLSFIFTSIDNLSAAQTLLTFLKKLALITPAEQKSLLELAIETKNIQLWNSLLMMATNTNLLSKTERKAFFNWNTTTKGNYLHDIGNSGDINFLANYVNALMHCYDLESVMAFLSRQAGEENYLGFNPYYFESDKLHPLNQCIRLFSESQDTVSVHEKFSQFQRIIAQKNKPNLEEKMVTLNKSPLTQLSIYPSKTLVTLNNQIIDATPFRLAPPD